MRSLAGGRREWLPTLCVWSSALFVTAVFVAIVGDILWNASGRISLEFLLGTPTDAGRAGGIGPILVSTFLILIVCLLAALPTGLGTAVLLAEYSDADSRFGRLVRRSLDVLAGVPSIVFGLFGSA